MRLDLLFLLLAVFLPGCASSTLLRDADYQPSLEHYKKGEAQAALDTFPSKEAGGFITTVEKSWLSLWTTEPTDLKSHEEVTRALEKQARTFDDRKFVSLTREAEVFLTQESEEGYLPSEDEVVTLHLVAAMAALRRSDDDYAAVEARRAAFYLTNSFNEHQPHFDDPALRIWLAAVWTALGQWDEAVVDLRRAAEITKDPLLRQRLETWASAEAPPKAMTLSFASVAPRLAWHDGQMEPEILEIQEGPMAPLVFPTTPWFRHHTERNTLLRDVLLHSNYMSQYLSLETSTIAQRGITHTTAIVLGAAGIAVGVAVIGATLYAASLVPGASSGDALALPVALGTGIIVGSYKGASKWDRENQVEIDKSESGGLQSLRTYRLVRFMPGWISLDDSELAGNARASRLILSRARNQSKVVFLNCF